MVIPSESASGVEAVLPLLEHEDAPSISAATPITHKIFFIIDYKNLFDSLLFIEKITQIHIKLQHAVAGYGTGHSYGAVAQI